MGPNIQGPEALLGRAIAGYALSRVVGRGLSGAVFLGERDAALVAVKVLLPALTLTPDELAAFRQRFLREAATIRTLAHPNILPVLDSGEDATTGLSFMVMPYMPNGTLADQVALRGPLPLAECTRFTAQLASALDYAHDKGIVHRDIKPANVLLDADGNAVLADFGIVKLFDAARTTLTTTGQVIGTPEFMAPEQARGEAIGPAADIYSLGALLYFLVTAQPPVQGNSVVEVLLRLVQGVPVPPQQLRADLPAPAAAAIMAALAKAPEHRFATATQFAEAFTLGVQGQWVALPGIPFATEQAPSDAITQTNMPEQPGFTPTPLPLYGATPPYGMAPAYGYPTPSGPLFDGAPMPVSPGRRGSALPASGIFGGIILMVAIVVLIAALFHFPPFGKGNAGNNGGTSTTFASVTATPTTAGVPIVAGSPTPTASPVPGASPTPTLLPTATLTAQPTNTPAVSATDTPIPAPTDTPTPVPTDTPTPVPTDTPIPTSACGTPYGTTFYDDFSGYPTGQAPSGYLLRGADGVAVTVQNPSGNNVLDFASVSNQYWDRWAIENAQTFCAPYTFTVKYQFQSNPSDRGGLTIAWNDASLDRIDIQPNIYWQNIEFRITYTGSVSSNPQVTGPGLPRGSMSFQTNTDYWLRVVVSNPTPGQGEVDVYWSADGVNFTQEVQATGLANTTGPIGVSTAGPNLPHAIFEMLSAQEGS